MRRYKVHQLASSDSKELESLIKIDEHDINLRDRNRTTPLHHAVYYNKQKCVKILIARGADVNAVDRNGSSPLHVACFIGALASVKMLVQAGATVDDEDEHGHTPLHKACFNGNERIVQYLLSKGANLNNVDRASRSCLHMAAALGKAKVLSLLLESGLKLDLRDGNKMTALHSAALADQAQSVVALLSKGADVNTKDWSGRTALHLACAVGSDSCVGVLISQMENCDVLDDDRASPLHHAAFNGYAGVVQFLLDHKADADLVDSSKVTAFEKACYKGHKAVVEILLYHAKSRGMSIDHSPIKGGLVAAASGGKKEIVEYLLELEVDPESVWLDDCNALTKAAYFGQMEIVELLLNKFKVKCHYKALHAAAYTGHEKILSLLLKNGCDVSEQDLEKGTALHSAAYSGHLGCCKKLIEAGADLCVADIRGNIPMHVAARNGHFDCLLLLVPPGSLGVADNDGMRALHHSIGHPKCVELLIEEIAKQGENCSLDDKDKNGFTPLHRALNMNKFEDAIALIKAGASLDMSDKNGNKPLNMDHPKLAEALASRARLSNFHQFEKAVVLFNEKPRKAIEFLREKKLVRDDQAAADIAEFLCTAKGLKLDVLGEYISEPGEFAAEVLKHFVSRFHFGSQTLEQAVRAYLLTFRLPGEAQRIDRIMQAFASRFHHENPDMFSHEDTAYLLAFSTIMLQTDAHNPAIKADKKMTKQQFLHNNRKIDQGRDLPEKMLSEIYDNIITTPIKMETGGQHGALHLANEETTGLLKVRADKGRWIKYWVILRENCIYYFASEKDKQPMGIIPLENLAVRKGNSPIQFEIVCPVENQPVKACKMESGILVPENARCFGFEAVAEQEADQWCAKIRSSIIGNPVRELMVQRRKQLERSQHTTQQFSETAQSHLGPQLQLALQMCVAASKGEEQVLNEYPGSIVRDPHGMLRYYIITNETSKSQFVVLVSHLWRDMDECELWAQSPTSGKLMEMCKAIRKNDKQEATNQSPLSSYSFRNMARKAFDMLCDDLEKQYGLFVVAHGISGPLAPIIARALKRQKFKVRKILTFGEPAIFTKRGVEKHLDPDYFRITHQHDVVPCFFPGFYHSGTEIMLFNDGSVTIVPRTERDESKGLAAKVVSSTFYRARQFAELVMNTPLGDDSPVSPKGSIKKASLAYQHQVQQIRPSFSSSEGTASGADVEKVFQDLLWENNRIVTYALLLKKPEDMNVVMFDSKRNEL